jgi:hypothetical protein
MDRSNEKKLTAQKMKKQLICSLLWLVIVASCSKEETKKADVITYQLTMKAAVASTGNTVFTSIQYKKADGSLTTLTNTTTTFSETFVITKNFNIFFAVSGVNDGTSTPDVSVYYEVMKFVNGVSNLQMCYGKSLVRTGTVGSWKFDSSHHVTFTEAACQ